MAKIKLEVLVILILKLGIIAALITGAATTQEYSYYLFLRWLVTFSSIYFAYRSYLRHRVDILFFFLATAILFNPFLKFWFQKATWHLIDFIIAGFIFVVSTPLIGQL